MLDLEIEPAEEPADQAITTGGRVLVPADPARGDVAKIVEEMPFDGEKSVEHPEINSLEAMETEPLLLRRKPPEESNIDVVVMAIDVRIGVVDGIVLPIP